MKDRFEDYEPVADNEGRLKAVEGSAEELDFDKKAAEIIGGVEVKSPSGEFNGFREDTFLDKIRNLGRRLKKSVRRSEKPYFNDDDIAQYAFFRREVYGPRRVFYPCPNLDVSPIRGFPDSEIVLVDKEKGLVKAMRKARIRQFVLGDVLTYTPKDPFDLVIILNPQLPSADLTRHLIPGGYVLANNYHNSASQLLENSGFEGIGTIDRNAQGIFLARGDFSKIEPHQWATYFYVFKKKE